MTGCTKSMSFTVSQILNQGSRLMPRAVLNLMERSIDAAAKAVFDSIGADFDESMVGLSIPVDILDEVMKDLNKFMIIADNAYPQEVIDSITAVTAQLATGDLKTLLETATAIGC